jgi:hypothetical protein
MSFPLFVPIFCGEPRHKKISTAIGAMRFWFLYIYFGLSFRKISDLWSCFADSVRTLNNGVVPSHPQSQRLCGTEMFHHIHKVRDSAERSCSITSTKSETLRNGFVSFHSKVKAFSELTTFSLLDCIFSIKVVLSLYQS